LKRQIPVPFVEFLIPKDKEYPVATILPKTFHGKEKGETIFIPIVAGPAQHLSQVRCIGMMEHHFAAKGEKLQLWMTINGDGLLLISTKVFSSGGSFVSSSCEFIKHTMFYSEKEFFQQVENNSGNSFGGSINLLNSSQKNLTNNPKEIYRITEGKFKPL
jgi:hypothetical protein